MESTISVPNLDGWLTAVWERILAASGDRQPLPSTLFAETCLDIVLSAGTFSPQCLEEAAQELGMPLSLDGELTKTRVAALVSHQIQARTLGLEEQAQQEQARLLWSSLTQHYVALWTTNHSVISLLPINSDARGQFLIARRNGLVGLALSCSDGLPAAGKVNGCVWCWRGQYTSQLPVADIVFQLP